jgi:UDP:flavonoid glycosyltransferase YjiC (YdhE family)
MRVLFTVSGWPTHYAAMVPLGWALQAAGHEVRVLCAPSQAQPVAHAGLLPVPVLGGRDVPTRLRLQYHAEAVAGIWPYPWLPPHPLTGRPLAGLRDFDLGEYRRTTEPALAAEEARSLDAAVAYARDWRPHLVLHDPASLEGVLISQVTGVRTALCLWGPVGTHEAPHLRVMPDDLSRSFPRYGVGEFDIDMITHVVDPCPSELAPPTPALRTPMRYVPYNGTGSAPVLTFPHGERPRVCVTWSTALSLMSGPDSYLLPEIVRGLANLDADVILTATERDVASLPAVPASVTVVERAPLRLLLPSCAAVVHHGGSGTTLTALLHGTPQISATFASEQTAAGQRVARTGAGVSMLGHLAGADAVRDAVLRVLEDASYRDAAGRLRDDLLSRPSPACTVSALQDLALG